MERVISLAKHFAVPTAIVINKADLNDEQAARIEEIAAEHGSKVIGKIPFDRSVNSALMAGKTVLDYDSNSQAAKVIRDIWRKIRMILQGKTV